MRVVPAPFFAVAINTRVFPTSREMLGDGVREIFLGTELATTWVGLPLLHAPSHKQPKAIPARAAPDANLPMSPFHRENEEIYVLERSQCRGCAFFRQPRRMVERFEN